MRVPWVVALPLKVPVPERVRPVVPSTAKLVEKAPAPTTALPATATATHDIILSPLSVSVVQCLDFASLVIVT